MTTQLSLLDICQNNHKGNPHSEAANKKACQSATRAKQTILAALRDAGEALSCETLEGLTGLSHQTCSARCSDLKRDGLIVVAGTSTTRSGCSCSTYKIL